MKKTFRYIKNFIQDKNVASITPSSTFCVRRVCKHIDFTEPNIIIEYGPGTGVFTREILARQKPGSELHAVELNPDFVEELKKLTGEGYRVHHASAAEVADRLGEEYRNKVDYIVSGIPFSFLDEATKMELLKVSKDLLKPGGKFLAYQTSGHLKEPLTEVFGNVDTEYEVLNIPPMMIYESINR